MSVASRGFFFFYIFIIFFSQPLLHAEPEPEAEAFDTVQTTLLYTTLHTQSTETTLV